MRQLEQAFRFSCGLELKNCMMLAPMTTSSGTNTGGLSDEDIAFILARSEGFGAVILGSHSISPTGNAFDSGWNIYQPENYEALASLVEQIHQQGTKAIVQIYHAGRLAQPTFIGGKQPIAPSRVPAERNFASYPKEMTTAEIIETIDAFRLATGMAIRLGFDGVELHGANGYLLQQFYSSHSNKRLDEWGGDAKKRMKFPIEVIKACRVAVREQAQRPFLIGYRFSPVEYESPGIRLTDTCQLLRIITDIPLDYVHISMNDFQKVSPEGYNIIDVISESVPSSVPLVGCGNIQTVNDVKNVLKKVSLFSVGNAVLIDPLWAKKIQKVSTDIKTRIQMTDRERIHIPRPLWKIMGESPLKYFHSQSKDQSL